MFQVLLHPIAQRELEALEQSFQEAIKKKLRELRQHPDRGKPLKHSPFRSLRIGNHRAIYEMVRAERKAIVLYIGHRKNVYSDFSKVF